tara:strand:- start:1191 stop:1862 length:672 start_codon:yes stop_codon:yes gene_type:complete
MDNISVIIRCRNEERYVGYAIQSVLDSFKKPEIVVIDNNSIDESMKIVRMFKKDESLNNGGNYTKLDVYNLDNYTPGKSLNYGVTKCSNDYVLVLSAHSQIMNCKFDKIKMCLDDYCVVGGKQTPIYKGKKIVPRYVWSNFIDKDDINLYSENEKRYFLHNAFAFYKKETLIKYPFDEILSGKEDRYWVNDRINKDNMKSYYDSDTMCYHHYTNNGATWKGIG